MSPTNEKPAAPVGTGTTGETNQHRQSTTTAADGKLDWYLNAEAWKPTATTTLSDMIDAIRSAEYAEKVGEVRTILAIGADKSDADKIKKSLPAVSLSGTVAGRRKSAVAENRFQHSGLLQIDLDAKDNPGWTVEDMREVLVGDPHIVAGFVTPSGRGVKGVARIPADASQHKAAFLAAEAHFKSLNLKIDPSCKDPVRLCFVSHDPNAWIREEPAEVFTPLDEPPPPAPPPPSPPRPPAPGTTTNDGGLVLRANGHSPPDAATTAAMLAPIPRQPYGPWLKIASAVWDGHGEAEGTALLKAWSPEEREGEYAAKYQHRLKDVHFASLVMIAKQHGYAPPSPPIAIDRPTGKEKIPIHQAFFYDGARYHFDTGKDFIPMDCASVSRHLLSRGTPKESIQSILCKIQVEGFIHYAGPLAGYQRGIHQENGCRLLASTSPKIIQPAAGTWPTLDAVICGLLAKDANDHAQIETFLGWLKFARESLVSGRRRPGQAVALAGPRGCGKSLLIDIVEAALGGRRCNPFPFFTGRTSFNADIAGAELLAIDDEAGSTDIRARKALAASIKSNLFSGAVRIEGKHRNAFTFRPCWRMILALNDEPEALLVLPPITEDVADKITLFKCHKAPLPMPAHTNDEKERFFAQLMEELPALLDWLEKWELPADLREERCGVKHYHHPDLLCALLELSPEGQLAGLIDTAESIGGIELPWSGTAADLSKILCTCPGIGQAAQDLLGEWQPSCGVYLGKLQGTGRVHRLPLSRGIQRWRVLSGGVVE